MFSKNHKSKTAVERMHIARIKEMPCGVCDAPPPSDAHHIEQQLHMTCIPLCRGCHMGFNGIHGEARIWKTLKKTEMTVLNETIRRMYD